jgi:signal transduction histidine kinase
MKTLTSRVLFVDEDREFLQQLRKAFPRGFNLETLNSVQEAGEKLRSEDFDVVAIELNILKSADTNLLDWVRKNRPLTVRIILTTSSDVAAKTAEQAEAFDYLIKPVGTEQLAYSIKRAIDHRRLLLAERAARTSLEKLNKQVGDRIRRATGVLVNSNQRLSASNRAKDQFLAAMSHELRTPLTAITGAVRILQTPQIPEAKAHSILNILDRNVVTLKRLLDDLLDCSRIASGKLILDLAPINWVDSINAAIETMRPKAADAGVELKVLLPSEPVTVNGSPLRLQQIAWNLIDNAIKFTAPGGSVFVSLSYIGEDVEMTVGDSGVGVPDEDKDRIFEPFMQVQGSENQKKGGLGIGLALVRNLTQLHNGRIRVESEGRGHGSRFIVTLPLSEKAFPFQQTA